MTIKGKGKLYKISIKNSAEKDIDRINEPYLGKIMNEIEILGNNPRNEKVKKLVGKTDEYRLKVGKYRILFYIIEDEKAVKIARVLLRKEAYR